MDVTNLTNGIGIVSGVIAINGGDQISGIIGAICAAICAAGYLLKAIAKIVRWCIDLRRKVQNGATAEEIAGHFGELEKLGEEIEEHGKKNSK